MIDLGKGNGVFSIFSDSDQLLSSLSFKAFGTKYMHKVSMSGRSLHWGNVLSHQTSQPYLPISIYNYPEATRKPMLLDSI